ncbi:MAG: exodeoxyribonuclease VII large subunit [Candidatus Rifleibacteriota bacterium]
MQPKKNQPEQMSLFKPEVPFPSKVFSVNELTNYMKGILEKDTLLASFWIQGEISNLVKAASGHCYFTLKDEKAIIKAALWAGNRRRITHDLKNGDFVMLYGSISLYPPRGEYQIIVTDVRPAGIGALYEAYEKLKKKLQAEGLFDAERKLSLPFIPKGVGIVTSPTGAVIKDIFRVIRRRFVNMPIYLVSARVQGDGAAKEIVAGIERLNKDPRVDVIIVARGGGSLEDLWPFNEEIVARAISASTKPVVSAVGHETDTTISDLVADKRAATPSVAGELVVPVKQELLENIRKLFSRLTNTIKMRLALFRQRYNKLAECRFLRNPSLIVAERRVAVLNLSRDLDATFKQFVANARHDYAVLVARLNGLNPAFLLKRGYIMATEKENRVITSVNGLRQGQQLKLHFSDGKAMVTVNQIIKEANDA